MTNENQGTSPAVVTHEYVEVAADLLAKPSALCDIVEAQGGQAALVFCNNPSDTDFVEVILKKRGISAAKLIGFVAPEKLEKTQERVRKADLAAVVVTDIAARGLDFSLFPLIVNYSLPSDSDTYNLRVGATQSGTRTAVSVVSPLDFANFHSMKTGTNYEFTKREPPSKEDLARAKIAKVKTCAQAKNASLDPALSELAKQIAKDGESNSIIAYLLQNLFEVVPQLQAQVDKLAWERENLDSEGGDDSGEGQSFRHGRDRGDRDSRGGRGDRQGRDRGQRGYDNDRGGGRDRDRGGRGRGRSEGNDDRDRDEDRRFHDRRDSDGDEGQLRHQREGHQRDGRQREDRRPPPQQKIRDDRLYIGQGERDGFSEDKFVELMKEHCGLERDQLKRFLLRKNYAFADLPEGVGADVAKKLDGMEGKGGSLYVARATQVVTVIENEAAEGEFEGGEATEEQQFDGDEQPVV